MPEKPAYRRVLLKLSGEALKGSSAGGIDPEAALALAGRVRLVADSGVQLAIVVGGGNLFRGLGASRNGMNRVAADHIGMLATVMNALALQHAFQQLGLDARAQSAIPMSAVCETYTVRHAIDHLDAGRIVIFGGGTGNPFFTTDTTAALRASEIGADAILKATKVDGIYAADPMKHPDAERYPRISYRDALARRLEVMDSTAFSMCQDNRIPIIVFNFNDPQGLSAILRGDLTHATLVSAEG